jgi:hypothetical protein
MLRTIYCWEVFKGQVALGIASFLRTDGCVCTAIVCQPMQYSIPC